VPDKKLKGKILENWNDIKDEVFGNHGKKSVLLGNGFSLACIDDDTITTETLIKKVQASLNNEISITNIEDYIHKVETQFITELYDLLPEEKINKFAYTENPIMDFLSKFDNYYTINYDTILYCLLMKIKKKKKKENKKEKINDGFVKKNNQFYWQKQKNKQNTFYLHGAFHFVRETPQNIRKIVRGDKNLLQTIEDEWEKGTKSHLVIASDSETKVLKLSDKYSKYLAYGYKKFKKLRGILVTVGVSFSDSDKHIVEAINNNNNLEHIYIGYYRAEERKKFEEKFGNNDKVTYFCTKDMFKNQKQIGYIRQKVKMKGEKFMTEEKIKERAIVETIVSELSALKEMYQSEMDEVFDEIPKKLYLETCFSITQNYTPVYDNIAGNIYLIQNVVLRTSIVKCYTMLKKFIEALVVYDKDFEKLGIADKKDSSIELKQQYIELKQKIDEVIEKAKSI